MPSTIFPQATYPLPPSTARFRSKPLPNTIPSSPFSLHLSPSLASSSPLPPPPHPRRTPIARATPAGTLESSSPAAAAAGHEKALEFEPKKEKLKVEVKTMEKPRLVLKFVWMDKNIGLGLDQMVPGHGCVPLSPYYFWPRKDAWEELKTKLEEKPWISQKRMIILLNQATDIINLWQQAGGNI